MFSDDDTDNHRLRKGIISQTMREIPYRVLSVLKQAVGLLKRQEGGGKVVNFKIF